VAIYANVTDPIRLAFDSTGVMYVGRDNSGSGGGAGDAVKIHRVGLGGAPVVEYGSSAIVDPDALVVDASGDIGSAGAVLVGGQISNAAGGHITEVAIDESITVLFGPTTAFHNPTDFVFESGGRLLFTNAVNPGTSSPGLYQSSGGPPTALFTTTSNLLGVALDPAGRIFVTASDGTIRIYDSSGSLIDGSFATGLGSSPLLAIGKLGSSSTDVFTVNISGELVRIEMSGSSTVIGTGFGTATDLQFGSDGALYVSEFVNDQVLRISPIPAVPSAGVPWLIVLITALAASTVRQLTA
jgi:hypothetical protein